MNPSMHKTLVLMSFFLMFGLIICAQKTGTASYYSNRFQGVRTTSGERLDNEMYTAAHNSLPFGTLVKVTNLKNSNWVIVRINDRGHFKRNRIIDVSLAAAKELDMVRLGIAEVKIETVQPVNGITIYDSPPILPPQKIEQLPINGIQPLPDNLPV